DRIHFHPERRVHIGNDGVLSLCMGQANRLGTMFKQVYDRSASQLERFRVHRRLQEGGALRALEFIQKNHDFHAIRKRTTENLFESSNIKEKELLRKTEVLLQQAIPLKAGLAVRQDRFITAETHLLNASRSHSDRGPLSILVLAAEQHLADLAEQQFIEPVRRLQVPP